MSKTVFSDRIVASSAAEAREDVIARDIADSLSLSLPVAKLLHDRGMNDPEEARRFILKREEQLYDPFLMKDMRKAAERVASALFSGERIIIYGDYDVDGVTSVSALLLFLRDRGGNVGYYIPKRDRDGYGVSLGAIERLAAERCDLIVTVDTGVTAVSEIKAATDAGIDVVVTDHHECQDTLPDALAVVNPKRADCAYPFDELAGVGVVFKLMCAVESILSPDDGMADCVRRVAAEYCDLIAIGTIADVMPVTDENRLIISYGLKLIEEGRRQAMNALMLAAAEGRTPPPKKKISAGYIGYTIAPRINAAGRMKDASTAVELFTTDDPERAEQLAAELCETNRERQRTENEIVEEAYAMIDRTHDLEHDPVIVLSSDVWHHGVIGIVASRIAERYGLSSILVSFEGENNDGGAEDVGKGSGRSVRGVNLVEALAACSDLLVKYGGHELAAGLTVRRGDLDEFRRRINDYVREKGKTVDESKTHPDADLELLPSDVSMTVAEELYLLEPYGVRNPTPVFYMSDVYISDETLVGGGKHTRMFLKKEEMTAVAMFFRNSISDIDLYPGDTADVLFNLDINEFNGTRSVQLIIRDIRLSENRAAAEKREREIFSAIFSSRTEELGLSDRERADSMPTRDDFAAVYSNIRKELRCDHRVFSIRALRHLLATRGIGLSYVKLKSILAVFRELNLIGVNEVGGTPDVYEFNEVNVSGKTSLDRSEILKKLKSELKMG
ncbi:MAG: single-stranded-DNA-specific exonuclease RecJ [Clostridia bacterium]|nr:single-stranded-DNA-specific exonuclease RecJ [Clostridia bacterium]